MLKTNFKKSKIYKKFYCLYDSWEWRKIRLSENRRRKAVIQTYSKDEFYLNIGAGRFIKKDWRILDYAEYKSSTIFPKKLIDFNINLTDFDTFPIQKESVDLIYSSHCFEHIGISAVEKVLKECYRILKPGGILRISVPDAELAYNKYKAKDVEFFKSLNNQRDKSSIESMFLDFFSPLDISAIEIMKFNEDFKRLNMEDFFYKYIPPLIDSSKHDFSRHICWFSYKRLHSLGVTTGFKKVLKSNQLNSNHSEMRSSEFDNTQPFSSLFIEMFK